METRTSPLKTKWSRHYLPPDVTKLINTYHLCNTHGKYLTWIDRQSDNFKFVGTSYNRTSLDSQEMKVGDLFWIKKAVCELWMDTTWGKDIFSDN